MPNGISEEELRAWEGRTNPRAIEAWLRRLVASGRITEEYAASLWDYLSTRISYRLPGQVREMEAQAFIQQREQMRGEQEEERQKRLAFLGEARGIPEPGRSWAQQEKARTMDKYWDWAVREFPEAQTVTHPFLEGLTGGATFQQFARGKVGELTRQYEKPRQEWWRGLHTLPIETPVGRRGFPEFYEWQRKERERDPLKMALEKYPFQEEFMKKPPRERGFYPGRTAPPARWLMY